MAPGGMGDASPPPGPSFKDWREARGPLRDPLTSTTSPTTGESWGHPCSPHHTTPHHTTLTPHSHHTTRTPYHTTPYYTYTTPHHTILYHTTPYYTIPHATPYYTILYDTTLLLYCTMRCDAYMFQTPGCGGFAVLLNKDRNCYLKSTLPADPMSVLRIFTSRDIYSLG